MGLLYFLPGVLSEVRVEYKERWRIENVIQSVLWEVGDEAEETEWTVRGHCPSTG